MAWTHSRADRQRDTATYNAEYRRNAQLTKQRDRQCMIRWDDGCTGEPDQADHITPVSQGGTHALTNLRGACTHCHRIKTAQEGGGARTVTHADPDPRPRTAW